MTGSTEIQDAAGLRKALGWIEYFTLTWGTIVGVGWVVVMDDWLKRGGPAGAASGFVLGGLLLIPIALVYGYMTAAAPVSDSELAYTKGLVPEWVRFLVGWMMLLAYLIVCPYEAIAIGQLSSYLFPQLETIPLYRVGGSVVYLPTLALGLAVVAGVTALNCTGVHHSARFQNAATFLLLGGLALFVVFGTARGAVANLSPPFSRTDGLGAVFAVVMMLQIVPYFLAGFESISRCSEERKDSFHQRRFLSVILVALGVAVGFYVAIVLSTAGLHPWQDLTRQKMATMYAFQKAFQENWVVNALVAAAVLSLLKVFNGCFLASTRQVFALGRARMLPGGLAALHSRSMTPTRAVVLVGLLTAGACLLGKSALVPISEVGSLAYLVGWLATCLAFCHPKWSKIRPGLAVGFAGVAVASGLLVLKLVPGVPGSLSRWEFTALGGWVGFGLLLHLWTRATAAAADVRRIAAALVLPGGSTTNNPRVVDLARLCLCGGPVIRVEDAAQARAAQKLGAVGVLWQPPAGERTPERAREVLEAISILPMFLREDREAFLAGYRTLYSDGGPGFFILDDLGGPAEQQEACVLACVSSPKQLPAERPVPVFVACKTPEDARDALRGGADGIVLHFLPDEPGMETLFGWLADLPRTWRKAPGERVVGVVALQGDYPLQQRLMEQAVALLDHRETAIRVVLLRTPAEFAEVDAVVLPGGWSNLQSLLMRRHGLDDHLRAMKARGVPMLGVCAGMILARARDGRHCEDRLALGLIDMAINNNAVSGEYRVEFAGRSIGPVRVVNAPVVVGDMGESVEVLARLETEGRPIVGVRQGTVMTFAFHEEVQVVFLRHCLRVWAGKESVSYLS